MLPPINDVIELVIYWADYSGGRVLDPIVKNWDYRFRFRPDKNVLSLNSTLNWDFNGETSPKVTSPRVTFSTIISSNLVLLFEQGAISKIQFAIDYTFVCNKRQGAVKVIQVQGINGVQIVFNTHRQADFGHVWDWIGPFRLLGWLEMTDGRSQIRII